MCLYVLSILLLELQGVAKSRHALFNFGTKFVIDMTNLFRNINTLSRVDYFSFNIPIRPVR